MAPELLTATNYAGLLWSQTVRFGDMSQIKSLLGKLKLPHAIHPLFDFFFQRIIFL